VGFEPGILCSVGGRDDHYTTPPGLFATTFPNQSPHAKYVAMRGGWCCIVFMPGGRCYDNKFMRFSPIFCDKMAFFLKTIVIIQFLQQRSEFWTQMPILFRHIFFAKIFLKNHNIGSWSGTPYIHIILCIYARRRGLCSGNVSACHRGIWNYRSWDRIPPRV
jgi:hypothetical protein